MPLTAIGAALAAGSMAGIPFFGGFIAKEQFYESIGMSPLPGIWSGVLVSLAVAASMCLGAAGLIAGIAPFRGRFTPAPAPHDAPPSLWLGPLVLGALGVVLGVLPALAAGPIALAGESVTGSRSTRHARPLARLHRHVAVERVDGRWFVGLVHLARSIVAASVADRAAGRAALHVHAGRARCAQPPRRSSDAECVTAFVRAHRRRHGHRAGERSRWRRGRALPPPRRWTPIQFHEAALAALIVAGALSATFARSSMAAALSLGTVGYGVAVMYALLGAPDLAMTQFAVETLTVVIFVLVFYRLRGFGDLSSRLVRSRDAIVAVTAGALVTTLVLFVGASGTTSRLAAYFADAAPRLAHGLNVVNVILVDFRGFDTLGETTVLVTVAIGVRALLLIGRERRQ